MKGKIHWFQNVNGKTANVGNQTENNKMPPYGGTDWLPGDKTVAKNNEPIDWLELVDGVYHRPEDDDLVKQGKRHSWRGDWWNKETREKQHIDKYDVYPGDGYTSVEPLKDEQFQKWNEKNKAWEVEADKKERAEKERELGQLTAQIEEAERKRIRSVLAELDGTATAEDTQYNAQYKAQIETLRPQITALKAELETAA